MTTRWEGGGAEKGAPQRKPGPCSGIPTPELEVLRLRSAQRRLGRIKYGQLKRGTCLERGTEALQKPVFSIYKGRSGDGRPKTKKQITN